MQNTLPDEPKLKVDTRNTKQRLSNEELSKLYPTPKSYGDKLEDRKTIQSTIQAKQPQYIAIYTALRLFIVILLGIALVSATPHIVMWNVISGVFGVALLALFWLGIVAWQYGEIASVLYKKEISIGSFFGFYLLVIAPLMIIACYMINQHIHSHLLILTYGALFLIHLLCVHFVIKNLSRKQHV